MAGAIIGAGASLLGGLTSGKGAAKAASAQAAAYQRGIDEQGREYDITRQNYAPYLSAGNNALQAELNLLGLGGTAGTGATAASGATPADLVRYLSSTADGSTADRIHAFLSANPNLSPDEQLTAIRGLADSGELSRLGAYQAANPYQAATAGTGGMSATQAQQAAYDALKASPAFTSRFNTGLEAILQNASATGGLRGGNTNNSLANFGSGLLADVIQGQIGNLGGLVTTGANAAGGVATAGQNYANAVSSLYGQQGQAQGVSAAAPYAIFGNALSGIGGALSGGGFGLGGGGVDHALPANFLSGLGSSGW